MTDLEDDLLVYIQGPNGSFLISTEIPCISFTERSDSDVSQNFSVIEVNTKFR